MQAISDLILGVSFGILSSFLFALQNVLFKSQKDHVSPTEANTIKIWIGLLVMVLVAILPFRPPSGDIPLETVLILAVSVLFGAAFGDLAYLTSQNRVGVSVAFPIAHTFPVFTYIFSMLALSEQFYLTRMLGVILAVFGVILVSREENAGKEPHESHESGLDKIGLGLAALTSVMLAVATLLIQIGMTQIDPIDGNLIRMFFGSLAMVPILILTRRRGDSLPNVKATKVILIGSLFGFAFASLFFVASIKYAGATISSVVSATAPLFALPLSFSHLKEHVTSNVVGGTLLAVLGVALAVIGVW
ncbi:MAG: DMT family transporter [Candidatus Thorarchaeota archaeon]